METSYNKPNKKFIKMTKLQIAVIILLSMLIGGIICIIPVVLLGNFQQVIGFDNLGLFSSSNDFIGKWERNIPTSEPNTMNFGCGFGYPKNIEFFSDGKYAVPAMSLGADLLVWPGGQYELVDNNRIRMQTNKGYSVYTYSIVGYVLSFVDDSNCKLDFLRIK